MNKENIVSVINGSEKLIIKFGAEWCKPCKAMAPILKDIEENNGIIVIDLDVDSESELTEEFGIKGIPTLIYYKNGEKINTSIGSLTKEAILNNF